MKKYVFSLLILSILFVSPLAFSGLFLTNAPRIHIKAGASLNWAGYGVETNLVSPQNGAVTDVKGTWVVPSVDSSVTPNAYASFWIGIDGYSSGTVEQIGTDSDSSSGKPKYYAWYEMYPKFSITLNMKISPGDTMSAEVKYLGNGNFQLAINDVTTRATFSTIQKSPKAKRSSAEWIAEAPSSSSNVLALADFGTITFTNAQATLNGHTGTISDASWQNDAITIATNSGTIKAQPSPLSSGGTTFSVTWHHS